MAMIFEPEHEDRAFEQLLGQFREQPNIRDLVRALCVGVQELEDVSYDYSVSTFLDLAKGYLLDRLGAFVGAQRLGATDDEFRRIIRARIAAQRSNGTIGEIGHVLALLTDPEVLHYSPAYPAGYRFFFVPSEGSLTDDEVRRAVRILELARPAGVDASYVEGASTDTFRFDIDPGFGRRFGRLIR